MDDETYYSRLTLKDVSDDDSAKYSVSVKNNLAYDFAHLSVAVEGTLKSIFFVKVWDSKLFAFIGLPHPPVEPPLVTLSGSDSVLVSWNACPFDGRRRVTSFILEKREISESKNKHKKKIPTGWQAVKHSEQNSTLELQRIVCGLVPGKNYQFRVSSVNDLGPGHYGPPSVVILIPGINTSFYNVLPFC